MTEPQSPDQRLASAARAILERDGRDLVLRPWQAAYLVALAGGHEAEVPIACGLGRGWLDARLADALADLDKPAAGTLASRPPGG